MGNLFSRIWEVLRSPNYSRTLSILTILIVAAAVPLTVYIAQQQQEIRQRAAGVFAIGGKVVNDDNVGISGVKVLIYNIRAGTDVSKIVTTGSNGTWVLDEPDILETDSFSVWPQCVTGYTGIPYDPPSGLNCDPKALSSPHTTFPGTTQFPHKGDYYDSTPTTRLSNLMTFDFMYTRTSSPPAPTVSPTSSGPTPTNVPFCSKTGEACRTSGTTDACCSGLECDASSVGSTTGICRTPVTQSKITVGGEVVNDDGIGIPSIKILLSVRHANDPSGVTDDNTTVATTTSPNGSWSATSPILAAGDTVSIWPQCVSGASTMTPYDLSGYICDGTQGPRATNTFAKVTWGGMTQFPHVGDYYVISPDKRSGNLTDFGFMYTRKIAYNPTPTNTPFCSKAGEACRTSGTDDLCCSGLECDVLSVGSATGICRTATNPPPPSGGCGENSDCADNEYCNMNVDKCQTVTCTNTDCKTYNVSNHTCVPTNKADGTACVDYGGTCQNGACTHAGDTILALKLSLTGIGGSGNPTPLRPQKYATLCLYGVGKISSGDNNCDNASYKITQKIIEFSDGKFANPIPAGNIVSGSYNVFVKVGKYLRKQLPGIQNIVSGTTISLSEATLNVGDINDDNKLDIFDYNIFVSCFGSKANSPACGTNKDLADFNDDGKVSDPDYKLFIDALSVREGD